MKKKGFTLIELLAVIVILAIIALIATPIVMNVIENARKGAAERSADNYIDAVETAIATERLDGKILDGDYTIQSDGNLCPETGCGENDVDKVTIDMSGNKPSSGTINISNGIVSTSSTMTVGDYTVSYNEEKKVFEATKNKVVALLTKICRPATATGDDAVTVGNVPSGNYAYGDEYICDPGDGVERRFFVIEDGDNTNLAKSDGSLHYETEDIGTTGLGEVSLIMDNNIGDTVAWASSRDNSGGPVVAQAYLKSQTIDKGWTVDVTLPTYPQMYNAISGSSSTWAIRHLNETKPQGYWTSTLYDVYDSDTYVIHYGAIFLNEYVDITEQYGVRPVITLQKD